MAMNTTTFAGINTLVRKNILNMKPYSSARDEFKGDAEVFLDANENPYPSPFNRYPDPLQWNVKKKLAAIKNIEPGQIFFGNGSDEAIDLIIRAFCEPNRDAILITTPTYGMYSVCADVNAVTVQEVKLVAESFDLDEEAILQSIRPETRVVFLCSPNNPTANSLTRNKIIRILSSFSGLVVIDEAYIDFSIEKSFVDELALYPNLIVMQTFSKAWGLAGLRLGMAFASPDIVAVLNKIKYPYNINIQTQELALKALANEDLKEKWVEEILAERDVLVKALQKLSIVLKVYPSDANFILVKIKNATETYQYLMNKKIIVRDRSKVVLCDQCLRITIGTPEENQRLIQALQQL
jgi:histidinol-phosphate aminotransferase